MANSVSGFSRTSNLYFDTLKLIDVSERELPPSPNGQGAVAKCIAISSRVACLSFALLEIGMVIAGRKASTLQTLKEVEGVVRVFDLTFSFALESIELSESDMTLSKCARFIEKGLMAPFADAFRVFAQAACYQEQHFIDMSPEERKEAKRPIYSVTSGGDVVVVGHKPVDIEECHENLKTFQKIDSKATEIRSLGEMGAGEMVASLAEPFYGRVIAYLRNRNGEDRELDLPACTIIPNALHQDAVLRRFICPITQRPIRDPVRDPTNNRTLYERHAILLWLNTARTSPMTRQPLNPEDLIDAVAVKAVIDRRLQHHQRGLENYLQQHVNDPVNLADQRIINQN